MSFWKTIKDYWKEMVLLPDLEDEEEPRVVEENSQRFDKPYIDNAFKYDTVMRSIDTKLKDGFPVKSGFSLIVTTKKSAIDTFSNSKLKFKLRCLDPVDKQFIFKHLNYDKLILTVSNSDVQDIFHTTLLPLTETIRCVNPHDNVKPGDIVCFKEHGYLYIFQYRGDYLTDREILDASFGTSTILENQGPSAMKLSYIRSMMDTNDHQVYKPEVTWIDILEKLESE